MKYIIIEILKTKTKEKNLGNCPKQPHDIQMTAETMESRGTFLCNEKKKVKTMNFVLGKNILQE
jgi:hypothetical protein